MLNSNNLDFRVHMDKGDREVKVAKVDKEDKASLI
jgi:hypothetical protein